MLMPFSKYYQDNYPVKEAGADAAKKVLTDAGYKANAKGIMEKDGKPASFKITNFGDDPTVARHRADPAEAAPGRPAWRSASTSAATPTSARLWAAATSS